MCSIIPTDGSATMASHWCLTHDCPATAQRCMDSTLGAAPAYVPTHRAFPLPALIPADYDRTTSNRAETFHTFGITR